MTMQDWLKEEKAPRDIYALLSRPLLDPDREDMLKAVQSANRELHPYQNHKCQDTVKRAIALMGELGRAVVILEQPDKFKSYNDHLEVRLHQELALAEGQQGPVATEAAWDADRVLSWLVGEWNVHTRSAERLARLWCAGAPGVEEDASARAASVPPSTRNKVFGGLLPAPGPRLVPPTSAGPPRGVTPTPGPDTRTPFARGFTPTHRPEARPPLRPRDTPPADDPPRKTWPIILGVALALPLLVLLSLVALPALFREPSPTNEATGGVAVVPVDPGPGNSGVGDGGEREKKALDAEAVRKLARQLEDNNWNVRREAAEALGKLGGAAAAVVPALVKILSDNDRLVRQAAGDALDKIDRDWAKSDTARKALPVLAKLLSEANSVARAADALVKFGPSAASAVPELVKLLSDNNTLVRRAAGDVLDKIDRDWAKSDAARDAVLGLVTRLARPSQVERTAAADALGKIDPDWVKSEAAQKALPALVKLLSDDTSTVRTAAADVLGKFGPRAAPAVPELVKLLTAAGFTVRRNVVVVLGKIGPGAAAAISDLVICLADSNFSVRSAAEEALNQIDKTWAESSEAKKAVIALKKLADGKGTVSKYAKEALVKIDKAPAKSPQPAVPDRVTEQVKLLASEKWEERKKAAEELGEMGLAAVPAITDLVKCLVDGTVNVRAAAAKALPKIDKNWAKSPAAHAAVPNLITALSHNDKWLRDAAATHLGDLGPGARRATTELVKRLVDREPVVRKAAAKALPKIDKEWAKSAAARDAENHLRRIGLSTRDNAVRTAADQALKEINKTRAPFRP